MLKSFSVYNLHFVQIRDGDNLILVQSHVLRLHCHLDRIFQDKNKNRNKKKQKTFSVVKTAIWLPEKKRDYRQFNDFAVLGPIYAHFG